MWRWLFLSFLVAQTAQAQRRLGLFVGSSSGPGAPLFWAEHDAARAMESALRLSGISPNDAVLLRSPDAQGLLGVLQRLMARAEAGATLWFFYSGRADATGLQLGATRMSWAMLSTLLRAAPAQVELQVFDVAWNGQPGTPPSLGLTLVSGPTTKETDLTGGLLTHRALSALAGGADTDGDRHVTLSEMRKAFGQLELPGGDQLVADTSQTHGISVPSVARDGVYRFVNETGAVAVQFERRCEPDCHHPQFIALPNGRYAIQRDGQTKPERIEVGEVTERAPSFNGSGLTTRGRRHWSARLLGGAHLSLNSQLPVTGGAALEATLHNLLGLGWSVSIDLGYSAAQGTINAGKAGMVRADFALIAGGVSAVYEFNALGLWVPWLGVRIGLLSATRTPVEAVLPIQNYTTISGGLVAGLTYRLPIRGLGISGRLRFSLAPFAEGSILPIVDVGVGLSYEFSPGELPNRADAQ